MVIVNNGRWLHGLGLVALAVTSALALRLSGGGDARSALFVAASYALLLMLFWCIRAFERAAGAGDAAAKGRLKLAVWLLASLLTVMFAARIAPLMPRAVAFLVWGTAAAAFTAWFRLLLSAARVNM